MGRDDSRRANPGRRENISDAASDYVSNASDAYYGDTLSPGALDYYRESPGPGESSILSPAETRMSPGYDETVYKSRGRGSPTTRDQSVRTPTPGGHPPCCVCELCNCGKHCCPTHGSPAPKQ